MMIGVKRWILSLLGVAILCSCSSKSSDDSSIDGGDSSDNLLQEDVDYSANFLNVSSVGLYAYGDSVSKSYNKESDQIIYKSDLSLYAVTNYSGSEHYQLSFGSAITSAQSLLVTITSQGLDGLSYTNLAMDVVKSSDDLCYWLWSDEKQVGAIVKLYE